MTTGAIRRSDLRQGGDVFMALFHFHFHVFSVNLFVLINKNKKEERKAR